MPFATRVEQVRARPSTTYVEAPSHRLDALDALRAGAMLLVVALHAAVPYTVVGLPDLLWCLRDGATGLLFDLGSWWALGASMPLFFALCGFFAADLYAKRGRRGYLVNRARRVVAPMAVGAAVILPISMYVWAYGWLVMGDCTLREVLRWKFHKPGIQPNLYGPAHFWFLEYLTIYLAGFAAYRSIIRKLPTSHTHISAWWRPLPFAAITGLILWVGQRQTGHDAVICLRNSFLPDIFRLAHHGVYFAAGVWLHRTRGDLSRLKPHSGIYLILSVPVFAARAWLLERNIAHGPLAGVWAVALAASGSLFGWLSLFGLLGVGQRWLDRPSAKVRYLADASYWIYLVHFPIVGLVQADLYRVDWSAPAKFAAVLGISLAMGLGSYQTMVRYGSIGRCLHGPRHRRPAA